MHVIYFCMTFKAVSPALPSPPASLFTYSAAYPTPPAGCHFKTKLSFQTHSGQHPCCILLRGQFLCHPVVLPCRSPASSFITGAQAGAIFHLPLPGHMRLIFPFHADSAPHYAISPCPQPSWRHQGKLVALGLCRDPAGMATNLSVYMTEL